MAILNFDATTVAPQEAIEALPAGWYVAQMTASEMKPTADGTGAMLVAGFTVIGGDFAGRKIFDRINLQNKNPVAVEIGYRTLSAICHAVGVIQVQDSQMLHGRPLQVKISLRPAGPGADGKHYEASNEVKGYKACDNNAVMPGTPAAPAWANQQQAPQQAAPQYAPQPQAPVYAQQPPAPAPQYAPAPQQAPAQQFAPAPQQAPAQSAPPPWAQQAAPAPTQQAPAPAPQQAAPAQQQAAPPWAQQAAPAAASIPPWAQPK